MSVSWILNRQYTASESNYTYNPFIDNFVDGFACSLHDEYPIEGEMGSPLPPFVAKFSESLLDGNLLCVADEDGHVRLIDTRKTKEFSLIKEWSAHSNAVFDLAWIADEPKMVTASGDQTARLWDIEKAETIANFRGHTCSLKSIAIQPNSNRVFVTGARDGNIMAWDTRCNRKNGFFNPTNTIAHAHALPTKEAGSIPGRKKRSRRSSMVNADQKASVTSAIFQAPHIVVSSGACDGTLKFWDLRKKHTNHKGDPVAFHSVPFPEKTPRPHGYSSLVVDSTKSRLYAACTNDTIYEYCTTNLSTNPTVTYQGHIVSSFYVKMALSPDDRFLLCGSSDGTAYIWRTDKPNCSPWKLKGHSGEVTSVTWSPNIGEKIVTCSDDNTFKIWRSFQNTEKSEVLAGTCQRQKETHEEDYEGTNATRIDAPVKRNKAFPSPLTLCMDKKITVSWDLYDITITEKRRQQKIASPIALTTPDSTTGSLGSPNVFTSVTPVQIVTTPKSTKSTKQLTPSSTSSTPKSLKTTKSGRTPRSSRLFMETWLKSPTSPSVDGHCMCTRKRSSENVKNQDAIDLTKLAVIEESSEPLNPQNIDRTTDTPESNKLKSDNQNKICSTGNQSHQKTRNINKVLTGSAEKPKKRITRNVTNKDTTPLRNNDTLIRSKKKLLAPKSENIKSFLTVSVNRKKRKRTETVDDESQENTKCLKIEQSDSVVIVDSNEGKENSCTKLCFKSSESQQSDDNKTIKNCDTPIRMKDLLDFADEQAC